MTLQSMWKKQEEGRNGDRQFPLPLAKGRMNTQVWGVTVPDRGWLSGQAAPFPCVTTTWSIRHHPQGLCPCPQSKPWAAQEDNPPLTAAEPPLQCQGREGAPPSRPPSWQRAVWASQEPCLCMHRWRTVNHELFLCQHPISAL